MSKHTPGPWRQSLIRVQREISGHLGKPIAYTTGKLVELDSIEDFANARLIAAAPQLLEALQEAYKYINGGSGQQTGLAFGALFDQVRAAIAKATGEAA